VLKASHGHAAAGDYMSHRCFRFFFGTAIGGGGGALGSGAADTKLLLNCDYKEKI